MKALARAALAGEDIRKRKPQLPLQNGGIGDGRNAGKAGKGKGKGKLKLKEKKEDGTSICYNWAKGKPCVQTPCPHAHCCRLCEGDHRTADCELYKK